ncbi:MAG: hypothetical protein IJS82_06495 [Paludibacteraceae bacterium]|nr:hypothetical protein [Paludibacteraceae bacterium]
MELIWKILNELAALVILLNFAACVALLVLTFKRINFYRKKQRIIRAIIIAVVSMACLLYSLSADKSYAMPFFAGGMALTFFYAVMLLRQFDDSREKKNKVLMRLLRWSILIMFLFGAIPALFIPGMEGKLTALGLVVLTTFLATIMIFYLTIDLSERDYCKQCGYYGAVDCTKEDVLKEETKSWDSEEWTETKRGGTKVGESAHETFHNTRVKKLVLMHMKCEHCGYEFQIQEEREDHFKVKK